MLSRAQLAATTVASPSAEPHHAHRQAAPNSLPCNPPPSPYSSALPSHAPFFSPPAVSAGEEDAAAGVKGGGVERGPRECATRGHHIQAGKAAAQRSTPSRLSSPADSLAWLIPPPVSSPPSPGCTGVVAPTCLPWRQPGHRASSGMPYSACSICKPQPRHVGLLHSGHLACTHIARFRFLF